MNENFNNSRTSDDIDMKLGPVPKLVKGNTRTLKKFDDDVMPEIVMLLSVLEYS